MLLRCGSHHALRHAAATLLLACSSSHGNDAPMSVGPGGGVTGVAAGGAPGAGASAAGGSINGGAAGAHGNGGATAAASGGTSSSGGMQSMGTSGAASGGTTSSGVGGASGAGGSARATGGGAGAGGSAGAAGAAGSSGAAGSTNPHEGPCDIFASGNTPCVAAHSTVRALYGSYGGSLYQVRRASDNATNDVGVVNAGGFADAASQDTFCRGAACVVTIVYDQSGRGNHLEYQGQGSSVGGQDKPASATGESLGVGGHRVYPLYINPGNSYWRDGHATGVPTGSAPEGLYMITSGTHVNGGCCFDYGNSETDRRADGAGAMDAIYFGTSCWFGGCSGSGPWVQADLEYGLFPGGSSSWNPKQVAFTSRYVTAMLKNDGTSRFALKGGNAQSGTLTTLWNGALPPSYGPMKKQGAIVLGSGGDCCERNTNQSLGTFYEGAIVSGYPSDATDGSIQDNVVAAGYE